MAAGGETSPGAAKPELTVRTIVLGLRPRQFWSVCGAIAVIAVGAFSLGVLVEGTSSERALLEETNKTEEKVRAVGRLEGEKFALEGALEVAGTRLEGLALRQAALGSKVEFLNRYVTYLAAGTPTSEKLFADYVCVMWKESQERQLHFDRQNVSITVDDLKQGAVSPDIQRLLAEYGISSNTADKLRSLEREATRPRVSPPFVSRGLRSNTDARDQLQRLEQKVTKQLAGVTLTKTVKFFDDDDAYELPKRIAVAVHTRSDCVPR